MEMSHRSARLSLSHFSLSLPLVHLSNHYFSVGMQEYGVTVAGGHGQGNRSDQLNQPWGIFVDGDQTVYVTDYNNHRVMGWQPVRPIELSNGCDC